MLNFLSKLGDWVMVDIKQFWASLKFSWVRRLLKTSAFWPKILELDVQKVTGKFTPIIDMLQLGPNMLPSLSKKFNNKFWKQVFNGIGPFMQGALFCHPKKTVICTVLGKPKPLCVFCSQVENFPKFELVSHLFYDCDFVLNFWQNLNIWLATLDINIPLDRVKLLFGVLTEPSNSVVNFTILCSKSFIWRSKFSTKELSLASFQKYFLHKLTDLKHVYKMIGKENKFEVWNDIYDYLSRLPE